MRLGHAVLQPPGEGPHPTVLALHGFRSSGRELLELLPPLLDGRALVLAPNGPFPVEPDPPGDELAYGWFPLTLARPPTGADVDRGVVEASDFLADAMQRYQIDPERLAVLGFSQGGVIAYGLALANPGRFDALVALSSWLPDALDAKLARVADDRLHAFVQHGTRDVTVAIHRGRDSKAKLERRGIRLTYREYDLAHEVSPQSRSDLAEWLAERL